MSAVSIDLAIEHALLIKAVATEQIKAEIRGDQASILNSASTLRVFAPVIRALADVGSELSNTRAAYSAGALTPRLVESAVTSWRVFRVAAEEVGVVVPVSGLETLLDHFRKERLSLASTFSVVGRALHRIGSCPLPKAKHLLRLSVVIRTITEALQSGKDLDEIIYGIQQRPIDPVAVNYDIDDTKPDRPKK